MSANPADALQGAFTVTFKHNGQQCTAYVFGDSFADADDRLQSIKKTGEIDGQVSKSIAMQPITAQKLFHFKRRRTDNGKEENNSERSRS